MSLEKEKLQTTPEATATTKAMAGEVSADVRVDSQVPSLSAVVDDMRALTEMESGLAEFGFRRFDPTEKGRMRYVSCKKFHFVVTQTWLILEPSPEADVYSVKLRGVHIFGCGYWGPPIGERFDRLMKIHEIVDFVKSTIPSLADGVRV